ncbi:aminomethyltransferase family protein [Klebsiella aerogenes]|uniref:aminomethyltransferase family protein n=1 Tax=Klebsiella aerogenes TaxID=548 RepID=UPI001CC5A690|nr:aminomethyltransferase family protein [Klebsiella aerogenes]EKV3450822.1 aminomethyltransferase family protein [Klebsiella aerogenes]ELA0204554.1 aminomethyltransferase family protein [Klebsiella aerogenes]ELA0225656.1 aminomethyltransferase family protein [Klebsiella aerogenes]MDN3793462.1 aminomethyltransferase family protein [Klebsiella aerogenes]UNX72796.1 aminomethyltransferase family protein [Klebsiella aerogenes]
MKLLSELHLQNNALMGIYNDKCVPSSYHDIFEEYKAVRENALLVDYSHMSITSVMGDDAWALVNYMASADVSIIRDEQGIYSLVLNVDGTIRGEVYILCAEEGYYILSEDMTSQEIINILNEVLLKAEELDIQDIPEIKSMDGEDWGVVMLEGPYAWEIMAEAYGFDIIGLPYYEYMNTDDGLMVFRCGKHGEFAYQLIGSQAVLVTMWMRLQEIGSKYLLKTGGLDYQGLVRIENPGWDESLYSSYSRNPVELQMQWAIQYDKEDFIGKSAVEALSLKSAERKLVGIIPDEECGHIDSDDLVMVNGHQVGVIVNAVYSPAKQNWIALALIDECYALADITGFSIVTTNGEFAAKTQSIPFIYNRSLLINPTTHSYVDASKAKSALETY